MELTLTLTNEYRQLWESCAVRQARLAAADAIVDQIVQNKQRYMAAGKPHGVPWFVVGIIHMLEGSGNFATHLHNGDPLTARTVRVPAGRPARGRPPFTWEESAADALVFDGLSRWKDWSLPGALFVLERFNGFGYRDKGIHSPYLWSFSNHYTKGKFVQDGVFSATAVSQQCGSAVLLSRMVARKLATVKGVTPNGQVPQDDDGILRKGAKGPAVKTLKRQLKKWFDVTSPGEWATLNVADDNVFGARLKRAVEIFQKRAGLLVDGEVGEDTREALAAKPTKPTAAKVKDLDFPGVLKRGATGEKVRLLQCWLSLHECRVAVDRSFLAATEKAVGKFQAKRGLQVTGVLDGPTWSALVEPMVAALTPIPKSDALGKMLVAYARQHLKQHPLEVGGENSGPWVRLYTDNQEGKPFPWCAGFATFCLKQACETMGVPMPIRKTLSCDEMATSSGMRFLKGETPDAIARLKPGSFFLKRAKPGAGFKYAHCGIIVSAAPETMETIEGNTNDEGSSEGFEVCTRTRGYVGMDFIVL